MKFQTKESKLSLRSNSVPHWVWPRHQLFQKSFLHTSDFPVSKEPGYSGSPDWLVLRCAQVAYSWWAHSVFLGGGSSTCNLQTHSMKRAELTILHSHSRCGKSFSTGPSELHGSVEWVRNRILATSKIPTWDFFFFSAQRNGLKNP